MKANLVSSLGSLDSGLTKEMLWTMYGVIPLSTVSTTNPNLKRIPYNRPLDMTARERQRDHKQFYLGKSADTFCPMVRIPDCWNMDLLGIS